MHISNANGKCNKAVFQIHTMNISHANSECKGRRIARGRADCDRRELQELVDGRLTASDTRLISPLDWLSMATPGDHESRGRSPRVPQ